MSQNQENRICEHCGKDFSITEGELSMYEKVGIELPTICFFCRIKQLLSFWWFGKFRKGKSDLSGEGLITVLPEKNRYPIYSLHEWHSDKWDAMDYRQEYDSSRSFFEQLQGIQEKVPHPHQNGAKNIGCDWCDDVWNSKNCYLSRSIMNCENLYYSYRNLQVKNSIDMIVCFNSETCFDSVNCYNSYKLFYSQNSKDCIDSCFLTDCRNCQSCFMCWNLRGKSYCIENKQYTKKEYLEKISSFQLDSFNSVQNFKKRFKEINKFETVHRENFNLKVYNSDGNFLLNDKNCHNCNTISDSEDCYNCVRNGWLKSNIDVCGGMYLELSGNCCLCQPNGYSLKYSSWSSARYSEYIDMCIDCENCFGCVGLKKKKYCIFNKQYSKEEYEKLKEEIISDMKKRGEYGKFLPYSMSAGPFNFSTSFLYFPETEKEDILKLGGYWEDINENHIEGMPTSELPDSINDISEEICNKALICPKTGWRFNIAVNELNFYKQNNIPLPRYHFDVRIKDNMKFTTVLQAFPYNCCFCNKEINAYYPLEWEYQKIACEECYKQNIN
jgi:hypothetical protein